MKPKLMNLIKPEKRMIFLSINESLAKVMVRCIDEKLEGLTMLIGKLDRVRLIGLNNGNR